MSARATAATDGPRQVEQRFTPEEAARLMRVSKDHVYRAIRGGDLVAKRFGKGYRVKGSDLEHWYDSLEDA